MWDKNKVVLFLTVALLICCGHGSIEARHKKPLPREKALLKDIVAFRKHHKQANIDMTEIVEKYIHAGDSVEKTKTFLVDAGFKITWIRENSEASIHAARKQKHPGVFCDEYVVILSYKESHVTRVLAKIFYLTF